MGIVVIGRTECASCGALLQEGDAYRYLRAYAGVHLIDGFCEGAYHQRCIDATPFRDAYLALEQRMARHRGCSARDAVTTGRRWGDHLWEIHCQSCDQILWRSGEPPQLGPDDTDPGLVDPL